LYDVGIAHLRVLLTKVPPLDGPQFRLALTTQGIPLFAVDIPRPKVFENAAAAKVFFSYVRTKSFPSLPRPWIS
jgi:hypothetical protein